MKINVGSTDRILRIIAGSAIVAAGFIFQTWWGVIGVIPIITGFVKTCPAYLPFGLSTCKVDKLKQ
ncbi:MAG: DUF2892 domain-containing protein [Bacteroidetes bacterium]|nr:DUF2892 domain-containing protein [Bacteroidota bacterium]